MRSWNRCDTGLLPRWRYRVEHVDTDSCGVTHFSRYASLLETVLLETLESSGAGLATLGVDLVVTDLRIRYLAPSRYRDVLLGAARIEHVGAARLHCWGALCRETLGGEPDRLVDGEIRFASVSGATGRPVPLPASAREVWKGLMPHA
jgi:acyl-CoA thioester hydrolase